MTLILARIYTAQNSIINNSWYHNSNFGIIQEMYIQKQYIGLELFSIHLTPIR